MITYSLSKITSGRWKDSVIDGSLLWGNVRYMVIDADPTFSLDPRARACGLLSLAISERDENDILLVTGIARNFFDPVAYDVIVRLQLEARP